LTPLGIRSKQPEQIKSAVKPAHSKIPRQLLFSDAIPFVSKPFGLEFADEFAVF
jgi:hypothetical protein